MFKKWIAFCLTVCLLLTSGIQSAFSETGFAAGQGENDPEIMKAIELGFVPENLQNDYEAHISYAEFCAVLDCFFVEMYPEKLENWKEISVKYRDADQLMTRMEGALVFLYAAEAAGIDAAGYQYNIPLEDLIADDVNFYKGVTWRYPLLPNRRAKYYNETIANSKHYSWRCDQDYLTNAKIFVESISYGNAKTYFDYDDRYSLNLGSPFILGDAIRAVERLYETARFFQYIPASEASNTVSAEAIALAADMPEVSWNHLPDWTGYTVDARDWVVNVSGMHYTKEEIDVLSSLGFNFVRVPLKSQNIFEGEKTENVNPAFLDTMDRLIEYCAEANIHVCLDLHDMPGFYTGSDKNDKITLWEKEETQALFADIWRFLARYYQNIPASLLSFNLLNEPHPEEDVSDELYSQVMLKAIKAIRDITPERLIFVDMLGEMEREPVEGLADAQVVQTVHTYFLSNDSQVWPIYAVNGFVRRKEGIFTIKGNFPAGTKIAIDIQSLHAQSVFSVSADGAAIGTLELGVDDVGENGCIEINEKGTDGEWREYENAILLATTTEACKEIEIIQEGGWWYWLRNLELEINGQTYFISGNEKAVSEEEPPVLLISSDGKISAENEDTLEVQAREWLVEIFEGYREFTEETGTLIMVQEFGFNETISYPATLAAADDLLSVLKEYQIPWCSWGSNFGPVADRRSMLWAKKIENEDLMRREAEYEAVSENWIVDKGLLEVYKRYMK
ncbi:MAG: cellulase family glycosylhydrolase [Clostridia bacterium]|nr:cellulase family glycosylhydrolase [Clostridia bacterium]